MDNRKNTILLTVIAVATLLVAVVGATFAYFTAKGGGTVTNNIEVKTGKYGDTSYDFWKVPYHDIDFETLHEIGNADE